MSTHDTLNCVMSQQWTAYWQQDWQTSGLQCLVLLIQILDVSSLNVSPVFLTRDFAAFLCLYFQALGKKKKKTHSQSGTTIFIRSSSVPFFQLFFHSAVKRRRSLGSVPIPSAWTAPYDSPFTPSHSALAVRHAWQNCHSMVFSFSKRYSELNYSSFRQLHNKESIFLTLSATSLFACFWPNIPQWARASSFTRFLDHIQRRTTVCRTPLDDWSARRRDLYLTTHNTQNRRTSMAPTGFEPTIWAGERPQTYALDRAATGTGYQIQLDFTKNLNLIANNISNIFY